VYPKDSTLDFEGLKLEGELKTKDEALDWLKSNRGKLWKV
jgi:hypothetical protein